MTAIPRISVIIGTYNQKEALAKVLSGFNLQTCLDFEVIVVDSSSTDGTQELLATWKPAYSFTYQIQPNQGKTGARNRAVELAAAPILLITDADMIPDPLLLETHLSAHKEAKTLTCFEGSTWNMYQLEWPAEPGNLYPYIREKLGSGAKLGWHYFLTGNLSLPTEIFHTHKGFDTDFQGYGWEDIEFGYRLAKAKIPLRYLPRAKNYHYHVVTDDDFIRREVKKGESAAVFLKKHPELKWFLGLNPVATWIAKRTREDSWLYTFATDCYTSKSTKRRQLGKWLLSEYHYRKGLLSAL